MPGTQPAVSRYLLHEQITKVCHMPPAETVYVRCLCSFISSINMNASFCSHHFTENNFSKVISKIPIATPEGVFPVADLSAFSDTGDFSSLGNSACWLPWHFLSWLTPKVSDCSFSVSLMASFPTFLPGSVLGPRLLRYYIVFGHSHLFSWFLSPAMTGDSQI